MTLKSFKYLLPILLVALCSFAAVWYLGGPNGTVIVKGGFRIDSALQLPLFNPAKKYTGKGVDSNFLIFASTTDSFPRYMKNGTVYPLATGATIYNSDGTLDGDRNVDGGSHKINWNDFSGWTIQTPSYVVGNSIYCDSSSGHFYFGAINGTGNSSRLIINDLAQSILLYSGDAISVSGANNVGVSTLVFTNSGGIVNTSISTHAYGTTVNVTPSDGTYDIQFTGSTGATKVNLPTGTNATIGTQYIVGDLDAIANTSNITIDAGTGNTIADATVAQTLVLSTAGSVARLKKITATKWKRE